MTPVQAKKMLEIMEQLSTQEGCQPYVDAIWTEEAQAQLPDYMQPESFEDSYAYFRHVYPAEIAQTIQEMLAAKDDPTKQIALDGKTEDVLIMACRAKGISLHALAKPVPTPPVQFDLSGIATEKEGETVEETMARILDADPGTLALAKNFHRMRDKAPIETYGEMADFILLYPHKIAQLAGQYKAGGRSPAATENKSEKKNP